MAINLYTLAIGVCLAASEPTTIMTVGTMDGKASEFALAPDGWAKWGATFGADVEFHVGTDDASREFPFIHPGPMDVWAGSASHAFSIEFPLDEVPAGQCLLQIGLCRSHYAYPPRFTGAKAAAKCVARPHRQWQIFVAMKTHYDLGYTEPWVYHGLTNTGPEPLIFVVVRFNSKGIQVPPRPDDRPDER